MGDILKIIIVYILRFVLSFFKIFKIKQNRIFFESFAGSQYSCNPKYIYLALLKSEKDYDFIWALNDASMLADGKAKIVKHNTLMYFFYVVTSKYFITNIGSSSIIPKREGSVWIETWHGGGAFKKVHLDEKNIYQKMQKMYISKNRNYVISSSARFSEVFSLAFGIPYTKYLKIGMPRNDILFSNNIVQKEISSKVRNIYNIPHDAFVVLYAPTFRGDYKTGKFDLSLNFELCKNAFQKRFKNKIFFFVRTHHAVKDSLSFSDAFINVKSYTDMQELIIASNALITDYSSTLWDCCLTKKPGFLFTPDVDQYRNERGFYTDISEWPYPYATTNEEFCKLILNYNESEAKNRIEEYLKSMDSYENGDACEQMVKIINSEVFV